MSNFSRLFDLAHKWGHTCLATHAGLCQIIFYCCRVDECNYIMWEIYVTLIAKIDAMIIKIHVD